MWHRLSICPSVRPKTVQRDIYIIESLHRDLGLPYQEPEPPQLAPSYAKEQLLYSESLAHDWILEMFRYRYQYRKMSLIPLKMLVSLSASTPRTDLITCILLSAKMHPATSHLVKLSLTDVAYLNSILPCRSKTVHGKLPCASTVNLERKENWRESM